MAKFNTKNLAIIIFLGILLIGITGTANAQQVLPKGGDSFETAVKLEPGSYKGGSLKNKEVEYFYITDVKFGQEINIKSTFVADNVNIGSWAILTLYDKNKTELAMEEDGFYEEPLSLTISQLHRGKNSDKYYIKTECDLFKIASYTLELSLKGEEEISSTGEEQSAESSNWVLIIGIIALIIVIAIVVYLVLKKKRHQQI